MKMGGPEGALVLFNLFTQTDQPASTLIGIPALVMNQLQVEIEATCVFAGLSQIRAVLVRVSTASGIIIT
jgi:hypothetical protein